MHFADSKLFLAGRPVGSPNDSLKLLVMRRWCFICGISDIVGIHAAQLVLQMGQFIAKFLDQLMLFQQNAIHFIQGRFLVSEADFQVGDSIFHCGFRSGAAVVFGLVVE